MSLVIKQVPSDETLSLLPILQDAEEGKERIRAALLDPTNAAYAARLDDQLIGAAVIHWEEDKPGEILYIAIAAALRGQGFGKQLIQALQHELYRLGGRSLLVGTANSSLENIAFYQKCGFRMFEIRHNYFAYIQPPVSEHGIQIRDMLVLRYDLE